LYRDFGPLVAAVLNSACGTHIHFDQMLQVDLPHWYKDRVVLLGDACHAGSVFNGQSALLAMKAARTLAVALSLERTLEAAFESYEQLLKPAMCGGRATGFAGVRCLSPRTEGEFLKRAASQGLAQLPWVGPLLKETFPLGMGGASLQE
jgi:2-polyprenyl-6-methoxyphenol hydroxylase-like FAD-dependent oxidoreductase